MALLSRFPVTAGFLAVVIVVNVLAGSAYGDLDRADLVHWGLGLDSILDREVFRLVTASFLSHDAAMFFRQLAFAAVVFGIHEYREGWKRTLVVFAGTDVIGSVLLLVIFVAPLSMSGYEQWSGLAQQHDVGMSGGGFGLLGSTMVGLSRRWRWAIVAAGLAALLIKPAFAFDPLADVLHVITYCAGVSVWMAFYRGLPSTTSSAR